MLVEVLGNSMYSYVCVCYVTEEQCYAVCVCVCVIVCACVYVCNCVCTCVIVCVSV